ncbi:MAG: 2-oxoglutarate dehydrogenase E1 component [Isosphaeraceae bacterium]|nr:2-oxoglutarate dehydrogenase E1 component [Isosphaeraceae bacterium]
MNRSTVANRWNLELIEAQYEKWKADPGSLDASWALFFEGYDLGTSASGRARSAPNSDSASESQAAVTRLIDAYREMGHYLADLDPLGLTPRQESLEQLDPAAFGLTDADLDRSFFNRLHEPPYSTLRELIAALRETYCRTIGVEFMHIRNPEIRAWLLERMEPQRNQPKFSKRQKWRIILKLVEADQFEAFLKLRFTGEKRFGIEGGETLIPMLDAIIERSGTYGVRDIVMGMPHRGRLNVLANILEKPISLIFSEFEGNMPGTVGGDGDVKYHLGFSSDRLPSEGEKIHISLTPNPSHLEAVNPVVEGRMRSKQRRYKDHDRSKGLPILMHGDAAFAGQGLVAETLNLSQLPGYRTGGTIHIVVNNQIGFTTDPADGRSTRYCTDVAKMIEAPIFHVNADDPEACVYVGELALDFRQKFGRDVVIDLICYRKNGHNEVDEPAFTQPIMYDMIRRKRPIREIYNEQLIASGELTRDEADTILETFRDKMQKVYDEIHDRSHEVKLPAPVGFNGHWRGMKREYSFDPVQTGVPRETLVEIVRKSAVIPDGFTPHPKVAELYANRVRAAEADGPVDWAFAESLAFGSLLLEKYPVRLSGQDCRRGTFSQRHAAWVDAKTGESYLPLQHLAPDQAEFTVYNSLLSEAAVLGFDFGYTVDEPNMLILWEAQFGDFCNGAQVIIDQFIASAESKWGRASGLVMLLPHGNEGQGPEHSSARLERFLQLCAEENIQVANATTPAQYFHLLRRQLKRNFRKPLILMTPKSLLRDKRAVSTLTEFTQGTFSEVLDEPVRNFQPRRVLFCSGKVYYDLIAKREKQGKVDEVAIVRLEQLYPWPIDALRAVVQRYKNSAADWIWVQEESQNNGAWTFVSSRLSELTRKPVLYVGRDSSASPATGSKLVHPREQDELVESALLGMELPHLVSATPRRAVALTSKD